MFAGPIFSREALTSPRQVRHFVIRAGYVAALFVLMYTAGQATFGWQQVRNLGDIARFGNLVFQVFALVQLSLAVFFALLFVAGGIAQEKDRQTLVLLLMTDMRDRELVLGKLCAGLLTVAVLMAASVPVFFLVHLLGGVSPRQIFWVLAISAAAALAAGSWGALVAFWREKTFQTLAVSMLGVVLLIGAAEAVVAVAGEDTLPARWAGLLDPYRALLQVLSPLAYHTASGPVSISALDSVAVLLGLSVVLIGVTVARLRVWNPSRFVYEAAGKKEAAERAAARSIWKNPVIWREIRTRAYGRKVFAIKLAYLALAGAAVYSLVGGGQGRLILGMVSPAGFVFVALSLISLILVNAQAVTAFTSERDAKTLELLLMTDVTAGEFVFGKLGGILYNAKELVLVPLILAGFFLADGGLSLENFVYLCAGFGVLVCFAAVLGLHAGLSYDSSRTAIANSLGTVFFLFVGIFVFMMILVEARSSFLLQLPSFLVVIGFGSIALYRSLSRKIPSEALMISAAMLPFLTFYGITEFLRNGTMSVCLAVVAAYGFATLAMLVPAVSEFDVALGRTTPEAG